MRVDSVAVYESRYPRIVEEHVNKQRNALGDISFDANRAELSLRKSRTRQKFRDLTAWSCNTPTCLI